jgi:endonuclease/exonuclease/phosphatase family metal-dependent hydrolase
MDFTLSDFDPKQTIRTVAANITSGNNQTYEAPGTRILQGLQPDVVMIQEFDVGSSSTADLRNWVDSTFGPEFNYFRENYSGIPNGVISRWPIVASGSWDDTTIGDRGFAWARIDIPGEKNLWVVSVHLKASSGSASQRQTQARQLVAYIQANVPPEDYLLLGGDFNTFSTNESCISTLGALLTTAAPHPVDQAGDPDTNANRNEQYDWVLAEPELDSLETPVKIGALSFAYGLVFDSRKFTPLNSVSPVLFGDSGASNMQHMAVVRAFAVPALELLTVTVSSSNPTLVPIANVVVGGTGVNRTVTVTPVASQVGTATITVTGGDGVSTASDTFIVTVGAAPVITSTSSYSGTVAVAGTNYVTATGTGPISYGASNLPAGLSLISSNGMILGTPTQAGFQQVVLTASNSYGLNLRTNFFFVGKGTAAITQGPAASAIAAGQPLSASVLTGGSASTAGTFVWTEPGSVPAVGRASYGVTFNPSDPANYHSAATMVAVTVNPAGSTYGGWLAGASASDRALLDFAFGAATPGALDPSLQPTVALVEGYLVLTYFVRQNTAGLTVRSKVSVDPAAGAAGWVTSGITDVAIGGPTTVNGVSVQQRTASVAVTEGQKFLRLEAEQE